MSKEKTQTLSMGDNYRLFRSDEKNLELEEYKLVKARKGRFVKEARESMKWVGGRFYSTVSDAARVVIDETQNENLKGELRDLIKITEQAKEQVSEAVKKAGLTLDSFDKPDDNRGRKTDDSVAKVSNKSTKKVKSVKKKGKRGRPAKVA